MRTCTASSIHPCTVWSLKYHIDQAEQPDRTNTQQEHGHDNSSQDCTVSPDHWTQCTQARGRSGRVTQCAEQ
jgi:hypothetical protein